MRSEVGMGGIVTDVGGHVNVQGGVTVSGYDRRAPCGTGKLELGYCVRTAGSFLSSPAMKPPDILLQASGVVAVCKPAGIATQAPPGIESLERWLRGRLEIGADGYVGVPHRLDRSVSGVVLLAATPRAARKLSRQFERREIEKTYLAVVDHQGGESSPAADGVCEWYDVLRKVPEEARSEIVAATEPGGREAVTRMRVVGGDAEGRRFLVQLEPLTGRMHQLRLQAASRGLPIVGDDLYGGTPLGDAESRERPILLHAWRIAYDDPDSGERIVVEAPLPDHWPAWAQPR
jgi:23S rRNA pseudouridine1911/1915/1917 synthase